MTLFSRWLASQREAHDRGEISTDTYAERLETKAKEVPDAKDSAFLKSRARFVRDDAENKSRDPRTEPKKKSSGGLW